MSKMRLWYVLALWISLLATPMRAGAADSKLTVILPRSYPEIVDQLLPAYRAQNPEVEIEVITPPGNYPQFIQLQFASGADFDLFPFSARDAVALIEGGLLSPLLPESIGLTGYEEFVDRYVPGIEPALRLGTDGYYHIPTQISSYGLYYNADHLLEAGVSEPPTTWEELGDLALRLTRTDGNGIVTRYGMGFFNVSAAYGGATWPTTFMHQAGIAPFDAEGRPQFSRPEAVEAIDAFVQMLRTGRAHFLAGGSFTSGQATFYPFYVDQVRRWQDSNPDLNMGTAQFPHLADGVRSSQMFTWGWFVNAQSDNIEGAWRLAGYLSSPETAPVWFDTGTLLQPFKGDWIQSLTVENPLFRPFIDEYSVAHLEFVHAKWAEIAGAMSRAMVAATSGEQPTRSALEELDRLIAGILNSPLGESK